MTSIRVACISDDLKKMVMKTYSKSTSIPLIKALVEEIKDLPECNGKEKLDKGSRSKQPRMVFLGQCMRSQAKGGEGKGMGECQTKWKEMSGVEKAKYESK